MELNLTEGVKFHEKLVNRIVPVELDLASSWIEMAVFKEKQLQVRWLFYAWLRLSVRQVFIVIFLFSVQVEQEEKRIQASLQAMLDDEKMGANGMLPSQLSKPKKVRFWFQVQQQYHIRCRSFSLND